MAHRAFVFIVVLVATALAGCAESRGDATVEPSPLLTFHEAWPLAEAVAWDANATFINAGAREPPNGNPPPPGIVMQAIPWLDELWVEPDASTDGAAHAWLLAFRRGDDRSTALLVGVWPNGRIERADDARVAEELRLEPSAHLADVDAVQDSSAAWLVLHQRPDVQSCLQQGPEYLFWTMLHMVDGGLRWAAVSRLSTPPIEVAVEQVVLNATTLKYTAGELACPAILAEAGYHAVAFDPLAPPHATTPMLFEGHHIMTLRLHYEGHALAARADAAMKVTAPDGQVKEFRLGPTTRAGAWSWNEAIVAGEWVLEFEGMIAPGTIVTMAWCASGHREGDVKAICEWVYDPGRNPRPGQI